MREEAEKSRFLQRLPGLLALVLLAGVIGVACNYQAVASKATHHNAQALAAKAEGGVQITATLATLGSFEWDAAPLTNKAADILVSIPLQLKKHEITRAQAQNRLDSADKAHDLVQAALKACNQDPKPPAHCRGNEIQARALLDQAKVQLSGL